MRLFEALDVFCLICTIYSIKNAEAGSEYWFAIGCTRQKNYFFYLLSLAPLLFFYYCVFASWSGHQRNKRTMHLSHIAFTGSLLSSFSVVQANDTELFLLFSINSAVVAAWKGLSKMAADGNLTELKTYYDPFCFSQLTDGRDFEMSLYVFLTFPWIFEWEWCRIWHSLMVYKRSDVPDFHFHLHCLSYFRIRRVALELWSFCFFILWGSRYG